MSQPTTSWPDLEVGLYDKLTGRGAQITYDFENFFVEVPSSTLPDASRARWHVNGTVKIRTSDLQQVR